MKQCPVCGTQYTDDTLQYCLQDGSPLAGVPAEEETVISSRSRFEAPATRRLDRPGPPAAPAGRSKTPWIVLATALATLLLVGIGGAALWFYTKQNRAPNVATDTKPVGRDAAHTPAPTPSPARNSNANGTANANSRPAVDPAAVRRQVTSTVNEWKENTESLDIDSLMGQYAERADYYNTSGASREAIRRDKERAFSSFDTVVLEISGLSIEVDDTGETATAEFDKEWEFEGERSSRGKVRSQLKLRKTNGRWLIVSERDL